MSLEIELKRIADAAPRGVAGGELVGAAADDPAVAKLRPAGTSLNLWRLELKARLTRLVNARRRREPSTTAKPGGRFIAGAR